MIEIRSVEEATVIDAEQLQQLEKFIRFYYELDINLEGIETITHLLQRLNAMRDEITVLRNKLRLYE
ncbi:MAG: chaperone modulator CbpM [Bacteroidota bacterium]|nr:chaperone modulator CbpM [Bacteroidota bacterium]